MTQYLSVLDIIVIHDRVVEETGGLMGVRDEHLLRSIAERPKASFGGVEQFSTIFLKAAAYLESIATYHIFLDGNKRTGLSVASVFLRANGYDIHLPVEESEAFMIEAAQRRKTAGEIAQWFEDKSARM